MDERTDEEHSLRTTVTVLDSVLVATLALTWWLGWLTVRLTRLSTRCTAARFELERELAGRARAAAAYAEAAGDAELAAAAAEALAASVQAGRATESAENALSRVLRRTPDGDPAGPEAAALLLAIGRVLLARQFHNDAVRDWRSLRTRPTVRLLRLLRLDRSGVEHAFFDIDDRALPWESTVESAGSAIGVAPLAATPATGTE